MSEIRDGRSLETAAAKAGMDEKTARKWRQRGRLPSECARPHDWSTRTDPFIEIWPALSQMLQVNAGLQAKTLFEYLQRQFPGRFADGQLRTLQRRLKFWRATEGPAREVMFPQEHRPGVLAASDFTHLSSVRITLGGEPFEHLLYHFVLTYSNWETGTVCFSESFEALAEGLQNALWQLGGVPQEHRTDRLTAAVINLRQAQEGPRPTQEAARADFTRRYEALLAHLGVRPVRTQAQHPHENGDAEQRHHRLKTAIEQSLLLRGHRDFDTRADYQRFLGDLFEQLNAGRQERLREELALLRPLPPARLDATRHLDKRVSPSSTLQVLGNAYSVPSRLIGEWVRVRVCPETLEVRYGQRLLETLPRLRGRGRHRIDYRHVIDWLVRKPGAFAHYRYQPDLFPTSRFRMAYDQLLERLPARAAQEYLAILQLAAAEGEARVDDALRLLLERQEPLAPEGVQATLASPQPASALTDVAVDPVDMHAYDALLANREVG